MATGSVHEIVIQCHVKGMKNNFFGNQCLCTGLERREDEQKALETNYTLLINQQKLENAKNEDNRENIRENIASNKRQIGVSVTNAWQNLQTARSSYEQAEGEAATEERNLTLAAQKWSAGLITEYEYQQAQAEWNTKQLAMKISYLELFEALETYRWKVSGLADAE